MDKNKDLISIIVPMYNVEKYIRNCVESIVCQTYDNIEIIMINDGSTDKTEKICLQLESIHPQIHYFCQKNSGAGAARNKGMELSHGKYVAFVDADDYLYPTYLEELFSLIIKFDVKLSCCSYEKGISENIDSFLKKVPVGNSKKLNREEALASLFYRKEIMGYPVIKLIERNLIKDIRFPVDLKVGEDFTFVYEILKKVDQVAYTSKRLYYYVQNQEGITHNLTEKDMKLLWHQIACTMLSGTTEGLEGIRKAIKSKLFVLAYDFLVKLKNNKNETEFKKVLIDYIKMNRINIAKDFNCKRSNRLLGVVCCVNINLAVEIGCFFVKMNWNLKKAL